MDSIVKYQAFSNGSFYVHYASKEALFTSLIKDHVAKVDTDYRSFLDSYPDNSSKEALFLSLFGKMADVLMGIGCDKMQVLYQAQITKDVDTVAVTSYKREIYKMSEKCWMWTKMGRIQELYSAPYSDQTFYDGNTGNCL